MRCDEIPIDLPQDSSVEVHSEDRAASVLGRS